MKSNVLQEWMTLSYPINNDEGAASRAHHIG